MIIAVMNAIKQLCREALKSQDFNTSDVEHDEQQFLHRSNQ